MKKFKCLHFAFAGILLQTFAGASMFAQGLAAPTSNLDQAIITSAPVASPAPVLNYTPIDQAKLAVPVQTPNDKELKARLQQQAMEYFRTSADRKSALEKLAVSKGIPLEARGANGVMNKLIEITPDGVPLYIVQHDTIAADSVNVDNIWPSGTIALWNDALVGGPSLSGAGQTIGLWDPSGSVRTTHDQFDNGRVTQLDFPASAVALHATTVAGALTSGGISAFSGTVDIGNMTRGAAYGATVHAYDFADYSGERAVEASTGMPLASQSFGVGCGWQYDGTSWIWYDTSANQEDWKFGAYIGVFGGAAPREMDSFAVSSPSSLLVYSAGNDRNNGPGGPVTYYLSTDPGKTSPKTATRDWNNGDSGGYDSLNPSACAKNVLTVGGSYDVQGGYTTPSSVVSAPFSSMGPTDDGRIKPDVVAPAIFQGTGTRNPLSLVGYLTPGIASDSYYVSSLDTVGTSFSAPTVAGGLALVLQRRDTDRPDWVNNGYPILSSTLRALAIHTADEAGANPGPDFTFGYGLFDAQAAEHLMDIDALATINPAGGHPMPYVKEVMLPTTKVVQFRARTPSSPTGPLKVTICWNDPAGPAQSLANGVDPRTKRLVNDLDLRIFPAGTTTFSPEQSGTARPYILNPDLIGKSAANRALAASTGDDSTNNTEQVVVNSPTSSSDYVVRVTHKGSLSGGQQWVSIIVSGADVIAAPNFVLTATSAGGSYVNITWPAVVGGIYRIQGSPNDVSGPWTDATGDISANLESMSVLVSASGSPYFWRGARYY